MKLLWKDRKLKSCMINNKNHSSKKGTRVVLQLNLLHMQFGSSSNSVHSYTISVRIFCCRIF